MGGLVVVGASLAGLRAVEAARRSGYDGRITLIGAEEHLPYDRPPLSKACLEANSDPIDTTFAAAADLATELDTDVVLGCPATALDPREKVVEVGDREIPYDSLVVATGVRPRTLPDTELLDGVHTLRTVDDARAIRAALDAGARTVVVGAGFIGSEVASSARMRGLPVTIVEAMSSPLVRAIGPMLGEACSAVHTANGADLRTGVGVAALAGGERVERVELTDGSVIAADLVVVGVGAEPATDWLRGAGVSLDDGVVCDETLNVGLPGVYAAGDCVRWFNPLFERQMRVEHWSAAAEQGAVAGANAVSPGAARAYATVPYFWSDWYGSRFQFVGLSEADDVEIVLGAPEDGRFVALYRRGDSLGAALSLNGQAEIMKYRGLIMKRAGWADALEFAGRRRSKLAPA